jgi:hypothetical protein
MVAPDQKISFASLSGAKTAPLKVIRPNTVVAANKVAIRPASEVRLLKVADSWSAATPKVAKLMLTWSAPASLYGGKFSGYQVTQSTDGGKTFKVLVINTNSAVRKYVVSKNLTAGVTYSYKVRAISKFGSTTKVGIFSKIVSAVPTAAPQAPVLLGSDTVVDGVSPTWLPQTLTQRGGLPVTYLVTATSAGAPNVTCSPPNTSTFSCSFTGLDPIRTYKATVTATSARGSATSLPSQVAQDPMFDDQWYLTGTYGINAQNRLVNQQGFIYFWGSHKACDRCCH